MSARHRPQRRVRGREREALRGLYAPCWLAMLDAGHAWVMATARHGCRPAQLRRCLLGLPVSARAAARILAAVGRP